MSTPAQTAVLAVFASLATILVACSGDSGESMPAATAVATTGKQDTALQALPDEVREAALAVRPDLTISEVEYEEREGRQYYDVGGTLDDGSELELDMMLLDGTWQVMEVQRDIAVDELPAIVAESMRETLDDWMPRRIIESDQGDGTVIYELFGDDGSGDTVKHEIRLEGDEVELLTEEWKH